MRIFTLVGELPFAGHPTLGSCHAWLEAGGRPARDSVIVQECGAGLVAIRRTEAGLAFEAPPRTRTGPVEGEDLERALRIMGLAAADVHAAEWVVNGPPWMALLLDSAAAVLAIEAQADGGPSDRHRPRGPVCTGVGVRVRGPRHLRDDRGAHARGPGHRQPECLGGPVADRVPGAPHRRTS